MRSSGFGVAPFPMLDQVTEQLAGPAHAAFEEGEPQSREAPGHTAQEDGLGDRVAGGGEMTDMVVDEVGRRQPQALVAARAVEGRSDTELLALRPDRIVVVIAVQRQDVVPNGETPRIGVGRRHGSDAPRHTAAEHPHLRPQLLRHVFKLGDRLVGRVHGNDRGRGHPVAQIAEVFGGDDVVGANHRSPGVVIADARHAQTGGRVDDREIGAELVKALVEQARHHRGRAIERVLRLTAPEGWLRDTPALSFGDRHAQRVARGLHRGEEPVGGPIAANLAHSLAEDGVEFDPVTVTVDHRVVQVRANLCWRLMPISAHVLSSPGQPVDAKMWWLRTPG